GQAQPQPGVRRRGPARGGRDGAGAGIVGRQTRAGAHCPRPGRGSGTGTGSGGEPGAGAGGREAGEGEPQAGRGQPGTGAAGGGRVLQRREEPAVPVTTHGPGEEVAAGENLALLPRVPRPTARRPEPAARGGGATVACRLHRERPRTFPRVSASLPPGP